MEHFTFEQLPQAISLLHEMISPTDQVLLEWQRQPETEEVFNRSRAATYLKFMIIDTLLVACSFLVIIKIKSLRQFLLLQLCL
jgi:hypothetical protein